MKLKPLVLFIFLVPAYASADDSLDSFVHSVNESDPVAGDTQTDLGLLAGSETLGEIDLDSESNKANSALPDISAEINAPEPVDVPQESEPSVTTGVW